MLSLIAQHCVVIVRRGKTRHGQFERVLVHPVFFLLIYCFVFSVVAPHYSIVDCRDTTDGQLFSLRFCVSERSHSRSVVFSELVANCTNQCRKVFSKAYQLDSSPIRGTRACSDNEYCEVKAAANLATEG